MNKTAIIAELRRSATADHNTLVSIDLQAFMIACLFTVKNKGEWVSSLNKEAIRMFYLLVAEALEQDPERKIK